MSRSYNKFPVVKDGNCREKGRMKAKDFANRAVRRSKEIPTGKGGYKKIYCSWFICDSRLIGCMNETEVLKEWENNIQFWHCSTYKEALWTWKKWYLRK